MSLILRQGCIHSQLTRYRKETKAVFNGHPLAHLGFFFFSHLHFLFCCKQSLKIYLVNKGQGKLEGCYRNTRTEAEE